MEKINFNPSSLTEVQDKLFEKLNGSGWDKKLRFFIKSSDFEDILLFLHQQRNMNCRFTPGLNSIFKPFQACPFDKLKVIFVCEEPAQIPHLNNGLAISHNGSLIEQFEFKAFYEELKRTVPNNSLLNAELLEWAAQGCLLLNSSLTVRVGYPKSHFKIWQPFFNAICDTLNREEDLVWVFFGESVYWEMIDNKTHRKLKVPVLPAERDGEWRTDIFTAINKCLSEKELETIIW